jgi:hypothetical protein
MNTEKDDEIMAGSLEIQAACFNLYLKSTQGARIQRIISLR